MTDKQKLEQQLWNIANTLRGKMGADDFRDYILDFIFYKYLSEKMHLYADELLKPDGIVYGDIDDGTDNGQEYLGAIQEEALDSLGYFLKPSELFSEIARRGNGGGKAKFILDDLSKVLNNIAQSTMGTESEEDFDHLFEDLDLTSSKLGKSETDKNELIVKVLTHLDAIDFRLQDSESDLLGDAYEYLIGLPANIFYGTSIPTCILVLKKKREQSDNILFIDASQHFEKAKNQNFLRPADIDKIVSTYRERATEDKYSYVADLAEVMENDYNLNIPRYVDTFEEEEPVDLQAVSAELKALDKDMIATDDLIAGFCKELGIETPF